MSLTTLIYSPKQWIGKIFFHLFLISCLLIVFYFPRHYTDPFFTSGMIWLGLVVPSFFCLYLLFIGKEIRLPKIWLYIVVTLLVKEIYAWGCNTFSLQQTLFSIVLCLIFLLLNNSEAYLKKKEIYFLMTIVAVSEALLAGCQYFRLVKIYNTQFPVTGTFENPAGLAVWLVTLFPFAFYFVFSASKKWKTWGVFASGLIITGLLLSGSRTGVMALFVVILSIIFYCIPINRRAFRWLMPTVCILTIGLLVGLYGLKKDSADGRFLIWRCTWEMVQERFFIGHGPGSFGGLYMSYQARYLKEHHDERLIWLAGNVTHPFNEYLKLGVEYGLIGLLFLFIGIIWLFRISKKYVTNFQPLFLSLIALSICALFTYPLNYPSICMLLFINLGLITQQEKAFVITETWKRYIAALIAIGLLIFAIYWKNMEIKWYQASRQALTGKSEVMSIYQDLYPFMRENPLFLYNYGAELHERQRWQESITKLDECAKQLNDIDVQILLSDNYMNLKNYTQAEECLLLASQMCPNRFLPLYNLMKLYDQTNRCEEAYHLATEIIKKQVKISSYTIENIKKEMEEYVKNKHLSNQ